MKFELRRKAFIENDLGQAFDIVCLGSCADGHGRVYWDIGLEVRSCPACMAKLGITQKEK